MNAGRRQPSLSRSQNSYKYDVKPLTDEGIRLESGEVTIPSETEDEVRDSLRSLFLSVRDCVRKHIAHQRAFVTDHGSTVAEILRGVEND